MGFAVALATLAIVVARFGDSIGGAVVIGALGLATGATGGGKVLGALGPRPRLWASPIQVGAGETFKVRWEAAGRFKDARSIEITWEGREVAIERGYGGAMYKATFATRVVTTVVGPLDGEASIELPHVLMPSFAVHNSRVEWLFHARVRTEGWPTAEEMYLIQVLPSQVDR